MNTLRQTFQRTDVRLGLAFAVLAVLAIVRPGVGSVSVSSESLQNPYAVGVAVLGAIIVLNRMLSGSWNIGRFVIGADGRPSLSKLQWFLWLSLIVLAYVVVWSARAFGKIGAEPITEIPANILTVLGLSSATMAAAKGLTTAQVNAGEADRKKTSEGKAADLVSDQDRDPDLSKLQLLAFTVVAVVVYVVTVVHRVDAIQALSAAPPANDLDAYGLPDIDSALMVLMGIAQAGYLGKKLVTKETPRLTGVTPAVAKAGETVTLQGVSLGKRADAGILKLDGYPIPWTDWKDDGDEVTFTVPPKNPSGADWTTDGSKVEVSIVTSGRDSVTRLPLTIKA